MKLLIMSDLHFEFMKDGGDAFLRRDWPDHDICIIAGDLSNAPGILDALIKVCKTFEKVIYITGNHEYYNGSFSYVHGKINCVRALDIAKNFTWLHNELKVINGIPFYGGTLWFPEHPNPNLKYGMNDFHVIQGSDNIYDEYKLFLGGIWDLPEGGVVISHHLPLEKSVASQFKNDPLNHFFMTDMSKQMLCLKPELWIHGHTHISCDYYCDFNDDVSPGCRVVCNPLGYPMEPWFHKWQPLIVDI